MTFNGFEAPDAKRIATIVKGVARRAEREGSSELHLGVDRADRGQLRVAGYISGVARSSPRLAVAMIERAPGGGPRVNRENLPVSWKELPGVLATMVDDAMKRYVAMHRPGERVVDRTSWRKGRMVTP